jgi:2,3-dihydroxyphenylpropionate 1,2-dioxygenase
MTGRANLVENTNKRDEFYAALATQRREILASGAEALIVVAAEHFANFFMNNMPAYCIGIADKYSGPIENPEWLKIEKREIPGNADLSRRLATEILHTTDIAYAQEWKFDHGIMVPLHFLTPDYRMPIVPININCQGPPLTPLVRAWTFGEALRRACDLAPEKLAVVGTGGISHWPATPDSGKINETWDLEFLDRLMRNDKHALLDYSDEQIYRDAGQGGFEIRTYIAAAAAAGATGTLQFYTAELPIFAVGCTVARFNLRSL